MFKLSKDSTRPTDENGRGSCTSRFASGTSGLTNENNETCTVLSDLFDIATLATLSGTTPAVDERPLAGVSVILFRVCLSSLSNRHACLTDRNTLWDPDSTCEYSRPKTASGS